MAEAEKIPKIDPAEVEILIERVKQNKLEEREAELIAGLLRTLLYLVAMLQDKKATLLRLREMIFGRKSETRKKADPESWSRPSAPHSPPLAVLIKAEGRWSPIAF